MRRRQQTVLEEGDFGVLRLGRAEGADSRGAGADEHEHDRHRGGEDAGDDRQLRCRADGLRRVLPIRFLRLNTFLITLRGHISFR